MQYKCASVFIYVVRFNLFEKEEEEGRLYGHPNGSNMDGSLQLNIKQLRKMIAELLLKIQHGKDGTEEEIAKMFK